MEREEKFGGGRGDVAGVEAEGKEKDDEGEEDETQEGEEDEAQKGEEHKG